MDARTFDRLIATAAHQRSRRGALRLLAAGLLGGVFLGRRVAPAAAQFDPEGDYDGDGLYNDDELNVYGTDPTLYDTDGDAVGDSEEVYFGTNPLGREFGVQLPGCYAVDADGNCTCFGVDANGNCIIGVSDPIPCRGIGYSCEHDSQCCNTAFVRCCWDGISLRTECTDVSPFGGACPN